MDQSGTVKLQAKAHGEVWVAEYPDGREEMCVKITIDCPACQKIHRFFIPGHHVLAMLRILSEAAEQHPHLTETTLHEIDRGEFEGEIPKDPSRN